MLRSLYQLLGSLKLSVVLLLLLALLTYLGTLAQVDKGLFEAQRLYFDSWLVLHPVRDLFVPLPGGHAVMGLLFVNLLVGGFIRMRRSWRLLGVYVTHIGVAVMLAAGFVKLYYSEEGSLSVFEGETANYFESNYYSELAIVRGQLANTKTATGQEVVIPERTLAQAQGQRVLVEHADLPFTLWIDGYAQNAHAVLQGSSGAPKDLDYVDGVGLLRLANSTERERDRAGVYLTIKSKAGTEQRAVLRISSMLAPEVWTAMIDGEPWSFDLRRQRMPLPFSVKLEDFRKEDYPGTSKPKLFESDVVQASANSSRAVKIEMNRPLRDEGFVLFQSNWGPQGVPDARVQFSVFAVVRNPSDKWPLISCGIISLGMAIHFLLILARYVRRQGATA